MGGAVDVLPEGLHARALQEPVDGALRGLAQGARDRAREALEVRRQLLLERRLGIEVRVELIDDVDGERLSNVVVLEEL